MTKRQLDSKINHVNYRLGNMTTRVFRVEDSLTLTKGLGWVHFGITLALGAKAFGWY